PCRTIATSLFCLLTLVARRYTRPRARIHRVANRVMPMSQPMNIASLEDDPAQAQLILSSLADAGHTCTVYPKGQEMIAALAKGHDYDLILLDWEVPDITG